MGQERCPVCDRGIYFPEWLKLLHCSGCGHWWERKGTEMPCKGNKKGKKGGKK